ncbi:MAG TPA: tetratricopeptide repeat protein, partial [Blastocatellia bacterium]|nr:tetratricopeptide repeat protein [Blastocatellia bacterium]
MLGHGPDDEHLGLGLADALITRLTNSGGLVVRSTSAVQKYTAADRDPVELGRRLKVDAVLDGNLQRTGNRVRLTVQLLNTADGKSLWGESVEEQAGDVFALQHSMAERLGTWLTQKLSADQPQPTRKDYTANPAAFEAYTHGRYFYSKQTSENYEKALKYYRQAIELDPNYALAWTGIADCYFSMSSTITTLGAKPNNNYLLESRAAAERAIALDETLAEAHLSLGTILTEKDYPAAIRELERTLELNPNYAQAHNVFSVMLLGIREFKKATAHAMRARDLDPLSISINTNLGMILFCDHRYDEAAAQLRKALELDENLPRARYFLGAVLGMQRRDEEAIVELQKAIQLSKGGMVPSCSLAYVYAVAGRRAEAQEILTRLLAEAESKPILPVYMGMAYVGLGDKERAFQWLEKVKGATLMNVARADPRFDSLRDDPRLAALYSQ